MVPDKIFRIVIAFLLALFILQSKSINAMTIGEERDIGEKLLYKIRAEFSIIDDPDISQYINQLGRKVLAKAGPRFFDYRFFVIPHKDFNAFAAPSGLIFFYTGLIETMKNEDELLSVLAHEIAHVESRHIASRSDKNAKIGAISMALAMASLALGDPSLSAGLFTGFQAAGQAVGLHFSRLDEEQADRLSYDWLHAMRRDPVAMEGMLRTMRRISRYRSEMIPPYLLTHPNPEARLDYVQSLLDYQKNTIQGDYYTQTDNFDFLRMKHRVMVAASDAQKVRAYFASIISSAKTPEEKMMATYGQAMLHAKEMNFSLALEGMAKVKAFFPQHSILDADEGIIHFDSGEIDRAVQLLESSLQKDPGGMYAAFHLARVYTSMGRTKDADKLFQRVLQVMPEYPQVHFELGKLKSDMGQAGMSNYHLAKYYLYNGKLESARQHLEKVKKDISLAEPVRTEAKTLLDRLDKLDKL